MPSTSSVQWDSVSYLVSMVSISGTIFTPVLEKLNKRKATIFIHPTTCNLRVSSSSTDLSTPEVNPVTPQTFPRPMLEFMFDETRSIASILLSGLLTKYQNLTFIRSHGACTLPPVIDRIGAFSSLLFNQPDATTGFKHLRKTRFYFDLAGKPFPDQIWGLLRMLGAMQGRDVRKEELEMVKGRLLYGSDFHLHRRGRWLGCLRI